MQRRAQYEIVANIVTLIQAQVKMVDIKSASHWNAMKLAGSTISKTDVATSRRQRMSTSCEKSLEGMYTAGISTHRQLGRARTERETNMRGPYLAP
jgi:hypothetical protein